MSCSRDTPHGDRRVVVVGVITGKERLLMEPGGIPVFYGDRVGQGWREGRRDRHEEQAVSSCAEGPSEQSDAAEMSNCLWPSGTCLPL